jgi:DNA-binding NarL/FixJ family response regulator
LRILLADDQPKVRFALRVLLERRSGFEVVGEAVDADDVLAKVRATGPDLILLEWELPGSVGADLLSALRGICPGLFIVALSGRPEACQAALAAGADAFVSKAEPPERLLATIARQNLPSVPGTAQSGRRSTPGHSPHSAGER